MAYTGPTTQSASSSSHASASGTYQADFNRFKEDLAGVLKSKLGIGMGGSRLYQKPYPPEFDFVSYPAGWRIPEFVKFNGEDSRTTWEHVSQYVLQLGEAGLNDSSDDEEKGVYAAEFVWPSKDKPSTCPSLKPIQKNRQNGMKFTFDVSKCDSIFDEF